MNLLQLEELDEVNFECDSDLGYKSRFSLVAQSSSNVDDRLLVLLKNKSYLSLSLNQIIKMAYCNALPTKKQQLSSPATFSAYDLQDIHPHLAVEVAMKTLFSHLSSLKCLHFARTGSHLEEG